MISSGVKSLRQFLTRPAAKWAGLAMLVMLVAAAGLQALRIYRAASDLRQTAGELAALAEGDPAEIDLDRAGQLIHRARIEAAELQSALVPLRPLTDRLAWVPRFGPSIVSVGPITDYAAGMTLAADELLTGMRPLLDLGSMQGSGSLSKRAFAVLDAAQPQLARAASALDSATRARGQFEVEALPASWQEQLLRVDELLPVAEQGIKLMQVFPELLGGEGARTYLLLAQNHDELRATGGFISGVGLLAVERGQVSEFSIGDSYAVDDYSESYPSPPEPLRRYMLAEQWVLRDANWSPDFPTAARQAQELYELSTGVDTDGVIAFDQTVVQRVLAAIGPVQVQGAPEPIRAENVESYMHQAWAESPEPGFSRDWWLGRKDFMGALGSAMLQQIQSAPDRQRLLALARAGMDLLRHKHLLIYLEDPAAQSQLAALGWDGAVRTGPGDFLMVVDSNVGFNKIDPWIERAILYQVDLSDLNRPFASLRLEYRHSLHEEPACTPGAYYGGRTYLDMQRRCYWNFFRIYVPRAVTPLSGRTIPVAAERLLSQVAEGGELTVEAGERGTLVFSGIFVLPGDQRSTVEVNYGLPANVLTAAPDGGWIYRLRVQKQPGTEAIPLEIRITLPNEHSIEAGGAWGISGPTTAVWSGRLETDLSLELHFMPMASR